MKTLFTLFLGLLLTFCATAQTDEQNFVRGQLIIQLKSNFDVESLPMQYLNTDSAQIKLSIIKCLSKRMKIYLIEFDTTVTDESSMIGILQNEPAIQVVQVNHKVKQRTTPNDAQFNQQWDLNNTGQSGNADVDIDAPEAWSITTGGTTFYSDTIVVADIDGGFDLNHQDINFWRNYNEVPNNGVDDDGNGYIDDYRGWDAYSSDGNIPSDNHGTHTAGTIAAKGNNSIGITGIGWNTQLMPIAGSSGDEATVVEAYGYAMDMRIAYNPSLDKGAFVVATNSSFGVDYGQPSAYPIWCAMYDSLGAHGILSAGATANLNINVDTQGDIPTACPSNWLVAVTNTTDTDNRNPGAAYGATKIDLGAPGTNTLSTTPGNTYSTLTGTSMATPHVAGAIGLLYGLKCKNFNDAVRNNPSGTALQIKNFLLQGVDTVPDLLNKTVSNGRLNLYKSLMLEKNYYGCWPTGIENINSEFENFRIYPNPAMSILNFQTLNSSDKEIKVEIVNSIGQIIFKENIRFNKGMNENQITIGDISSGVYLISLLDLKTLSITTSTFIKQ